MLSNEKNSGERGPIPQQSLRDDAVLQFAVPAPFFLAGFSIIMSNRVLKVELDAVTNRLDKMEGKLDKHNNFMERIAVLEQKDAAQWRWIDEMKDKVL